ncbi:MAG: hypothetical protein JNL18_08075 [Planctomycetaceae bacterium]|nr:hypothetical protein [Planctomycetaceae bacterium]
MRTFALLFLGVVVGWAASCVDWTRAAVGQEGSVLTERLTTPEAVPAGDAVATQQVEMPPFLTQFPGRYQIAAEGATCYRLDTVTGRVWHITLHAQPRIVASAVDAEFGR